MRGKPAGGAVLAAIARPLCQWLHGSAYLTRRRLSCGFPNAAGHASVPVLQPIMVMDGEHTMSCKGSMRR